MMNILNTKEKFYAEDNTTIYEDENLVIIREDKTANLLYGKLIAMTLLERNNEGKIVIIVDGLFNRLSQEGQLFVIAHELGHHRKPLKEAPYTEEERIAVVLDNKVAQEELEADRYAMKKIGFRTAVKGLVNMRNMLLSIPLVSKDNPTIHEITLRILDLIKYQLKVGIN